MMTVKMAVMPKAMRAPFFHAVVFSGPKILSSKGGDGEAHGVDRHPVDEVQLAIDGPGCHGLGAKGVDAGLNDHIADGI